MRADACNIDPIVVHQSADGTYRMPGHANAKVPAGYERVELRTIRHIEQFESTVNRQHKSIIDRKADREQRRYEEATSQRHARLRHAINHGFTMKDSDGKTVTFGAMSPMGRLLAERAMRRSNEKKPQHTYDPGFRVEILHTDASNREPWRDKDTNWQKRRG